MDKFSQHYSFVRVLLDICPVNPSLSVLVRVKNEMAALPEFWDRLKRQGCFDSLEIIFLDSGSSDGTIEFLNQLPCRLFEIDPSQFSFGSSCNLLMSHSTAPLAVFLSGHVFLTKPTDLESVITVLRSHSSTAVYMRQTPNTVLGGNAYDRAYLARRFPPHGGATSVEFHHPGSFSNAASGLTRSAWISNPFPETAASEDFIWVQSHLKNKRRLFYLPSVEVMHSHNESPDQVFSRVRLNRIGRGLRPSYARALYAFAGVFASILRADGKLAEAWTYAKSHAKAYL